MDTIDRRRRYLELWKLQQDTVELDIQQDAIERKLEENRHLMKVMREDLRGMMVSTGKETEVVLVDAGNVLIIRRGERGVSIERVDSTI